MADSGSSAPTGFDCWKVLRKLGSGGNSDVWYVKHEKTRVEGALKCLRRSKGISLRRFQYEVEALQALAGPGIIPLLDYHLPAGDNPADAWVVMPRASEIDPQISFEDLIRHMAFLAEVLASIHDRGYSHRDIKPGNILEYHKQWVLCDFGLVSYPEKPEETPLDGKLGPLHFLAPEMLRTAGQSDGKAADIYSFAKTLWVLATGQKMPLPGEQPSNSHFCQLDTWTDHPRAHILNDLLDRCTRHDPLSRPGAAEVQKELSLWLIGNDISLPKTAFPDRSHIIQALVSPYVRSADHARSRQRQVSEFASAWWEKLRPYAEEALASTGLPPVEQKHYPDFEKPLLMNAITWGKPIWPFCRMLEIRAPGTYAHLLVGIHVSFYPPHSGFMGEKVGNRLVISAGHIVRGPYMAPSKDSTYNTGLFNRRLPVRLGSAEAEIIRNKIEKDFIEALPATLDSFQRSLTPTKR